MTDPMPVFTIKAKDNLATGAIADYRQRAHACGLVDQAAEVQKALVEIVEWRQRNRHLCHDPDHTHVPATVTTEPGVKRADAPSDVVTALRDMADRIDRGPTFPVPPSVISALVRERADQIELEATDG